MKAKTPKKAAKKAVKTPAKKVGRPSSYCPKVAGTICKRIAEGESLKSICDEKGMPNAETVRKWLHDFPAFLGNYARAREQQADHYADEMVEIADNATDPNKARLQIDARKWKASKLLPKKYGDKLDITTRDETPPVTREDMIAMMRKSPSYLAQIKAMVAEAEKPVA